MKVTRVETLRCDAGWRMFSFLKVMPDEGLVGWSEYNESFGSAGLSQVIEALSSTVIGKDPRQIELINAHLRTRTIQSRGGINRQAVAAIENALLDIKGKGLGVPVYDLFGGPVRTRIPVYWSHCGSYRARYPELLGVPRVQSYDELPRLGEGGGRSGVKAAQGKVARRGFKALKTNVALRDGKTLASYRPGFGYSQGYPELNWDADIVKAAVDTASAFRAGAGPSMGIMMDLNFNYKTEGFGGIARARAPLGR